MRQWILSEIYIYLGIHPITVRRTDDDSWQPTDEYWREYLPFSFSFIVDRFNAVDELMTWGAVVVSVIVRWRSTNWRQRNLLRRKTVSVLSAHESRWAPVAPAVELPHVVVAEHGALSRKLSQWGFHVDPKLEPYSFGRLRPTTTTRLTIKQRENPVLLPLRRWRLNRLKNNPAPTGRRPSNYTQVPTETTSQSFMNSHSDNLLKFNTRCSHSFLSSSSSYFSLRSVHSWTSAPIQRRLYQARTNTCRHATIALDRTRKLTQAHTQAHIGLQARTQAHTHDTHLRRQTVPLAHADTDARCAGFPASVKKPRSRFAVFRSTTSIGDA